MPDFIKNLVNHFLMKPSRLIKEEPVEEDVLANVFVLYDSLLLQYLPYYKELTDKEKQRFIKRLYRFHRSKSFHFVGMEEEKNAPVLISAAAVQITFGLKRFLLPFFRDIFIMPDAYHLRGANELYIGHVSPKGIYISWRHFLEGFSIPNDGVNVAFHELAHAVHHENFMDDVGVDWDFREDFAKISHVFGPSLTQMLIDRKSYLRGYAFRNFHEFWAVSVEAFFEDPSGLKENMPHLYKILCEVLNQDPLKTPKIL